MSKQSKIKNKNLVLRDIVNYAVSLELKSFNIEYYADEGWVLARKLTYDPFTGIECVETIADLKPFFEELSEKYECKSVDELMTEIARAGKITEKREWYEGKKEEKVKSMWREYKINDTLFSSLILTRSEWSKQNKLRYMNIHLEIFVKAKP